jgi:hypothetical protein
VHKDLKFRTTKEAVDEARFAPHPFHRVAQFTPQIWDREAAHIAQFDSLELLPEALIGIQLWGIGRQALQMEALRRPIGQKLPDRVAAVDRRAIPDEHHPARHLPQQVLKKCHHVVRVDGVVLAVEVELAFGRDGGDGRQMVAGTPLPQDRRLPPGGIGAHDTGQGIESGFI